MTWTDSSPCVETKACEESENQTFYKLTAGTVKDFFFWVLFHFPIWEGEHENSDLQAFFLSSPLYGESFSIIQAMSDV